MLLKGQELYEFEDFRLDVTERFLVRISGGERVQLSEKAFETLCVLVRNSGHLVNKDELINQVWAESFVEENNLNKCIYAIRRALGEKSGKPQFIETVKKHGFRFVADVRRIHSEEAADPVLQHNGSHSKTNGNLVGEFPRLPKQPAMQRSGAVVALADWRHETTADERVENFSPISAKEELAEQNPELKLVTAKPDRENIHKSKYRLPLAVLAAFIIGAIALGYYFYNSQRHLIAAGKKSIAVLPVKPINTSNRDDLYEIGIADSLIQRLSSINGVTVRPLSAIRQYTDLAQDPLAAGREQKTDYVLASNYQLADGRIRITAQLFNVATGKIEETYKSEKDAGSVFAMQDAIAGEIGNKLLALFATTSINPAAKRGTTNEEAYRLYLQGKNLTAKRKQADAQKAVEYFEQAIRLDPNYTLAFVGMARAYMATGTLRGRAGEAYEKARAAVNKAEELDANSADVYAVRGGLKYLYEWDFAGAEKDQRRAIELEPNNDLAHWGYAELLGRQGRFEEAFAENEIALEIDPNSIEYQHERGRLFYFAHRYDESIVHLERVLEIDPNFNTSSNTLYRAYEMKGDYAKAYESFIKDQKMRNSEHIEDYQKAYETGGWQNVNRKMLEFEKFNEQTASNYYQIARQYALLNEKEQAFEYLNKALEERQTQMGMLKVEPMFDSLRDDPRFNELLRRVGLK